jgi:lysozyme
MTPAGIARLKADEGLRLFPYRDTRGYLSIGYGRNLDSKGIRASEADLMFANDVAEAEAILSQDAWFSTLDPVRQDVCVNMMFNLGDHGFDSFIHFIRALHERDYNTAAAQILNSKADTEDPERYDRLAAAMRSGSWQSELIAEGSSACSVGCGPLSAGTAQPQS